MTDCNALANKLTDIADKLAGTGNHNEVADILIVAGKLRQDSINASPRAREDIARIIRDALEGMLFTGNTLDIADTILTHLSLTAPPANATNGTTDGTLDYWKAPPGWLARDVEQASQQVKKWAAPAAAPTLGRERDLLSRVLETYFPASEKQPPLIQEARAALSAPHQAVADEKAALDPDTYNLVNYLERLPTEEILIAKEMRKIVRPQYLLAEHRDAIVAGCLARSVAETKEPLTELLTLAKNRILYLTAIVHERHEATSDEIVSRIDAVVMANYKPTTDKGELK